MCPALNWYYHHLVNTASAHGRSTSHSLRIVHIKNDPLKRRSLSGAEGSAIELIESMGVGFGFATCPRSLISKKILNGSIISRSILKGKHPVVTFVEKVYQTGVKLTKQEMQKVEEQINSTSRSEKVVCKYYC
jgi:hypothetical protein